ncbi:GNAT family N-acetyltransferase [Streptomyces sp. NPDC048057]|uniref:GNAT family N-acetyltransferase n=1 Tax=Streptomyces sp. NPDC048057 TaxID=3155628 RepID=UPI0033FC4BD3
MNSEAYGALDGKPSRKVRQRTDDDVAECVRVLAETHRTDGYPMNWPAQPGDWLSSGPLIGSWVAELDGRIVGHVNLSRGDGADAAPALWTERHGPQSATAVVSRLFVAPEARGHGIGTLLMDHVVTEARLHDLHPVLDVIASHPSAALYERLGWELLATVDRQWPNRTVQVRCYAAPS